MFRTPLILEAGKPDQWIVRRPLVWATRSDKLDAITVPKGFVTDLASVPRFLRDRKAFDVNGASRRAAVLHDYLYATGLGGKDFADNLFRMALRAEGVGATAAWAFYQAVHLFGGGIYAGHTARRAAVAAQKAVQ